jgi:hypothetical protein
VLGYITYLDDEFIIGKKLRIIGGPVNFYSGNQITSDSQTVFLLILRTDGSRPGVTPNLCQYNSYRSGSSLTQASHLA